MAKTLMGEVSFHSQGCNNVCGIIFQKVLRDIEEKNDHLVEMSAENQEQYSPFFICWDFFLILFSTFFQHLWKKQ